MATKSTKSTKSVVESVALTEAERAEYDARIAEWNRIVATNKDIGLPEHDEAIPVFAPNRASLDWLRAARKRLVLGEPVDRTMTLAKLNAQRAEYEQMLAAKEAAVNTKTPEQQAELDKMRAAKAQAAATTFTPEEQDAMSEFAAAAEKLTEQFGVISWKRWVISRVAGLATNFCGGYASGVVLSMAYYALVASGWVFLAWVVAILGALVAIYLSVKAGAIVRDYVAVGIDRHWAAVKGFFSSSPDAKPAAA